MNLKTFIFVFFSFVLLATLATGQTNPYNKLDKLKVNDLIAQKLEVQSTTKGAIPCPSMTQTQRNAIPTPLEASCVFNQDSNSLNVYDGSGWVEVGAGGAGGGGINNWETAYFYDIGDVVIESNKIYQCNTAHTSSVFATDIAKWTKLVAPISLTTEVSGVLPMANGGSEKALTPVLGGVVYTDGGSMEVLGAGTSGQLLKSNGAAAPEWTTLSVDDATFSGVLSLGKGGTNKSLTASNGAIAYSDTDSIELLAPGTAGQILQSNGVGAPSYVNKSISGKNENASSVTLEEIQVSNNQLTQTDVNKHLLESGNSNILSNPSFEHSTVSTSWTSSAGTLAAESSVVVNGKKSLSVNLSTQALAITQDSTLYAAQFADGVQGLASVRVKTSLSGIRVCSRQASVTSTTNCVNVQGNGKWGLYKVPMILGATSNGISIASNGTSLTGTVYLDDAFVGATDLKQEMNACNSPSCETEFSAAISGAGVITQESSDWLGTCVRSGTGNRTATCTINASLGLTTGMNCAGNINQAVTTAFSAGVVNVVSTSSTNIVFDTAQASDGAGVGLPSYIVCQKQGADFTAAKQLSNGNTYSSTNADTDWASCGHTTSSFTGLGTVTNINTQCKRQGGDLLMKGSFTVGVVTAVEARLSLPLWNGVQLVSANSSIIPSLQLSGDMIYSASSAVTFRHATLIEPSVSYMTFAYQSSTNAAFQKILGTVMSTNNQNFSFSSRIPIAGWEQSNIIIGQFNGLESCSSTLECTDTFSAKVSAAGVVSDENVNWINGNCTNSSGLGTCTFNTSIFSVTPNCSVTYDGAGNTFAGRTASVRSASSTQILYITEAGSVVAAPVNIICQKQGVDYVGKTAKAVASDQSLRTPGVTNAVFYSAGISSAGAILTEIGDFINGNCSCSSGSYSCTFVSGSFTSTPSCQITNPNSRDRNVLYPTESTSSLTWSVLTQAGTGVCEAVKISCHGIKQ